VTTSGVNQDALRECHVLYEPWGSGGAALLSLRSRLLSMQLVGWAVCFSSLAGGLAWRAVVVPRLPEVAQSIHYAEGGHDEPDMWGNPYRRISQAVYSCGVNERDDLGIGDDVVVVSHLDKRLWCLQNGRAVPSRVLLYRRIGLLASVASVAGLLIAVASHFRDWLSGSVWRSVSAGSCAGLVVARLLLQRDPWDRFSTATLVATHADLSGLVMMELSTVCGSVLMGFATVQAVVMSQGWCPESPPRSVRKVGRGE